MKKTINPACIFIIALFLTVNSYSQTSTITIWKDSAIGAVWNEASNTVAYGKPDANGYYKIYLADSAGNNVRPLTYSGWRTDRHQWPEEWDPTGNYLICYVEKDVYAFESGHTRIPDDAIPGYGGYTDIWVIKRDGTQAWQLTNLPNDYNSGVLHGAISADGTVFAWTQRIAAPGPWWDFNLNTGTNVFKVATLTLGSTPSLSNIHTFQPGNVAAGGELESISNDKTTIAFYSTFESKNIVATPLYTLDTVTKQIKKLTTESFSQCPTFTPDGNRIVYMTGHGCDIFPWEVQGADWYIMDKDSMNKQRITYMNVTNHAQSDNHYRLAGSLSFMSNTSFLGGIMTNPAGLVGYTAKVNFSNLYTGIKEANNDAPDFFIFPNPASDLINIMISDNPGKMVYSVFNPIGSKVSEGEIYGNSCSIDISNLTSGVYFLKLFDGKNERIEKISISK